ncbi:MAG: repeat-containing protein [Bryobacterales bacterium]|nr:repeat-containing protein [Bryobacterales bacterium]
MFRTLAVSVALFALDVSAADLELRGQITGAPHVRTLRVNLFSVETPYAESAELNHSGEFRFRSLAPGNYTVAVVRNGLGEVRRTVVVSSAVADKSGVVYAAIPYTSAEAAANPSGGVVSVQQISVPGNASAKYVDAQRRLAARDPAGAVRSLEEAVAIAPQFSAAWNALGVIAFQNGDAARAELLFRKSLAADPGAFEPLVNLGGVLLKKSAAVDALPFNQRAVHDRPEDALANAQLGMNYFKLDQFDQAEQYLRTAERLDPAHFSQPQLFLADIYARRGNRSAAVRELEALLAIRPDGPLSESIRRNLAHLVQ